MGLFDFGKKECKPLEAVLFSLQMNMSNNYKDNAQSNLKELEEAFVRLRESGALKGKACMNYEAILADYREKMKGYSHKDQKPYWH